MAADFYPLFIALAGAVAAALLTERALTRMHPGDKAALVDASARTRLITLLVMALFVGLVLWRPFVAWVFLAASFLALAVRMVVRLRRLTLPPPAARLLLTGQLLGVAGIVTCACIYALRSSH